MTVALSARHKCRQDRKTNSTTNFDATPPRAFLDAFATLAPEEFSLFLQADHRAGAKCERFMPGGPTAFLLVVRSAVPECRPAPNRTVQ